MKKIAALSTLVIYLAFACGVMINYHYCMDRFASFSLYKAAGDWCPTCHMHKGDRDCCHDEVKIVKLQDDHQASSPITIEKLSEAAVPGVAGLGADIFAGPSSKGPFCNRPPPLHPPRDICIMNSVFRI